MEFSNNGDKINIPDEYIGNVNFRKFEGNIKKRKSKDRVFRFYHKLINFLKFKYRGSLPRDIISLARKFGYDDFLVALFSLTEEEYKKAQKRRLEARSVQEAENEVECLPDISCKIWKCKYASLSGAAGSCMYGC